MIVRERRREIGVLKAIGASNIKIMAQFVSESLVLTLISSLIGAAMGAVLSNPILNVLVNNSAETTGNDRVQNAVRGGGMMMRLADSGTRIGNTLKDIHAVVGWQVLLYGLLAAIVIAIVGSAIPSFLIAKIRPAEVMRADS